MQSDIFKEELLNIQDINIRENAKIILNLLPNYYFIVPASSTGRYHPDFALNKGGLIRHVKVALYMCEQLFNDAVFNKFDNHKKDLIRLAIMIHDGLKKGVDEEEYTRFDHPLLVGQFLKDNIDKLTLSKEDIDTLDRILSSHMGPWNTSSYSDVTLPIPKENDEIFVHLCDYIASRSALNVNFDENDNIRKRN